MITISIQGMEIEVTVLIIKKLVYNIILGVDALNKLHATIDFPNKILKCTVNNSKHDIRLGRRREDNTAAKFFRLYNGPYTLSEQVGKNTFILTNPNTNRAIGKFHASSLRKYYTCLLYTSRCV